MQTLSREIQKQFDKMCKTGILFKVEFTGQEVWDLYLSTLVENGDPVFRDPSSTTHNCKLCNNFIRRYGNIVAIDDNYNLMSIFDVEFDKLPEHYKKVVKLLSNKIRSSSIKDVFFETLKDLSTLSYGPVDKKSTSFKLGVAKNVKRYTREEAEKFGIVRPNELREFHHFHLELPTAFVDKNGYTIEYIMGFYRDNTHVFRRAMEEISLSTLELVRDLIQQGSLLDGTTHLHKVEAMIPLKKEYDELASSKRLNWIWKKSHKFQFAKFKNELIGVLCTELSQGEELNKACESWNKRVDPTNYMKAKAPITQKQINEARKFIEENGYLDSFDRRFATIDDIKASEIKHMNSGDGRIREVSIFDDVKPNKHQHVRNKFDGIEEVSIEKFMKDILPSCTLVEAWLTNKHVNNMVSLTTSSREDSKRIFKWDNNYSWTYNGNIAGKSQIKEAVKSQGGKVDGVLRFSIMWSEGDNDDSDLDAHCIEPDGNRIYFANHHSYRTKGDLDIDIRNPLWHKRNGKEVVENITYPSLNTMIDGEYKFHVNQYHARNSRGFKAEIEVNGELYSYEYNQPVSGDINVARVTLKNGQFSINHSLRETSVSREIYGLDSNNFHKVNLVCLSPNHWGENNIGNKHYFFMLEGCKSPTSIRSFHNENLNGDLLQHRKVMEVLGATRMIESSNEQLSGLGFNSTVKDELIVRLSGNFKRVVKIKF